MYVILKTISMPGGVLLFHGLFYRAVVQYWLLRSVTEAEIHVSI